MISFTRVFAMVCVAGLATALVVADADARVGSGGSRGTRTFSAPSATKTAPNGAAPIQRTVTPPGPPSGTPGIGAPATAGGGFFNRPGGLFGGGLLGGLAAGFIGAGLFGMLFGHGFLGGLGGFASLLGLILQVALVVIVARLAWAWWQRRQQPAMAGGPSLRNAQPGGGLGGLGLGGLGGGGANARPASGPSDEIGIKPADYDAFEGLLGVIQTAYSNEDIAGLKKYATPEMVSYFSEDLSDNASRGVVNRVSDVKLLQGDLAEAWREGGSEYATVAMRFSLVDQILDRNAGRIVDGSDRPQEVTELWTFVRSRGGNWILSAIQEA
jgi:predicted lipid-binding transport protein (Tim44 family)